MIKKSIKTGGAGTKKALKPSDAGTDSRDKKTTRQKGITLDHGLHFNLLTEPWLPVVGLDGEKKFLSLNDFLKSAHRLERFDFPLPGLETAVLRFLVAMVHIVGAPENKKVWEAWLTRGKFDDAFVRKLQQYKEKLDLFSPTEPFMQVVDFDDQEIEDDEIKYFLLSIQGASSSHWDHKFFNSIPTHFRLSPHAAIWMLLFYNMFTKMDGRGYKFGIIGSPPLVTFIIAENLYKTVVLNTTYNEFIMDHVMKKSLGQPRAGWINNYREKKIHSSEIRIQDGFLWKSRSIILLPESNEEGFECILTNQKTPIIVKRMVFAPQKHILKEKSFWWDPNVTYRYIGDIIKSLLPDSTLPVWRDYPSLTYTKKHEIKDKLGRTKEFRLPSLVVQQIYNSKGFVDIKNKLRLRVLAYKTDNFKIELTKENLLSLFPELLDEVEIYKRLQLMIQEIKLFQYEIIIALKIAYGIKKGSKQKQPDFQSSYWHELGSSFEESLSGIAETDKDPNEVLRDWKIMLAEHVRSTFMRHTEKLLINPKHLKHYQAARAYLENRIRKELLPVKNNDTPSVSEGARHARKSCQ